MLEHTTFLHKAFWVQYDHFMKVISNDKEDKIVLTTIRINIYNTYKYYIIINTIVINTILINI